ncbi:MAG TPA: RHS repeat-associated core domain-containing protein, partial [Roseiflexaceae bacterium]|nr:RHS repeat-associated core domain-containing protein [Roseiflexaceae bacterium]
NYHYNSLGQRDRVTDALGATWQFTYDNLGRQVGQTDPLGHTVSSVYDALGRKLSLTQDGRTERWKYNADGTLAEFGDFMGRVTRFSHDADRRVIGVDYPAGTSDVAYTFDAAGNLLEMADGLGTTTYAYDALNRLQTRTRDGRTVSYAYAADNQVAQIDYWGRGSATYTYDDAGRLSSLSPWDAPATSYSYRTDGLLASQARPNGVTTNYGYDSAGRLTELLHQRNGTALNDILYTLDRNGNRTQLQDVDGITTFSYDALDRLVQVAYPELPGLEGTAQSFTFDAVGNRLGDDASTFEYDSSDRIANPGFSYDANGNLLSDGAATYSYDAANRLIGSTRNGVTTTYGYDGHGNLVRETVGGVTTDFVLDERGVLPHILGEVHSDGTETLYAYGAEGFAAQQTLVNGTPQGVRYALLDGLGSLRQLTDSNGAVVLNRSYDAFGALRANTGSETSRMGFTGEPTGAADGLVYLRARHYNPALGRFLQRDSFAGFANRPQSLNRYAYAENNPATLTDPSGHCPFCVAVAAGAAIGAAFEYGSQVIDNYSSGKRGWDMLTDVQADKIGYAALQGAVAGGVGFFAGPLVGALARGGMLGSVVGGSLEGMSAGALGQLAENLLRGCSWDTGMLTAVLGGGFSGGLGGRLGWKAKQLGQKSAQQTPLVLAAVAGNPEDIAMQAARLAKPWDGYYDVAMHGRADALKLFKNGDTEWVSA